jgi:hypothetical protein
MLQRLVDERAVSFDKRHDSATEAEFDRSARKLPILFKLYGPEALVITLDQAKAERG